jgi:hypothetical protein
MAPKVAMVAAPAQVRIVPMSEKRVNGSLRSKVAKAVLNTRPACSKSRSAYVGLRKSISGSGTYGLEG